jgi:hypothetical protein
MHTLSGTQVGIVSHLSKLTLVNESLAKQASPVIQKRMRLSECLKEQQQMAAAMINQQPFTKYESMWITNKETDEKVRTEVPKTIKPWYWEADGVWYLECRYGNRRLMFRDGMRIIKVGKLDHLVQVIGLVISAVEAGELDEQLKAAYARNLD